MSEAIVLENVSKHFRRYRADRPNSLKSAFLQGLRGLRAKETFWALRDVDLSVSQGVALGIIGANGAGKSTMLRLIGGVGRPDSGKIRVRGRIGALLDLTAGFAPDLTGRENVFITGVICGLTRRELAKRFDEIVAFAQLENFIDNPIRTYSTGMQMRLGFAIAAHTDPEVLLIDEVLAVGDIAFQQKCMGKIEQFRKAGCTILMISHDPAQMKELCDRVVWLKSGKIVADGNPELIVRQYVSELADETRRRTPTAKTIIQTAFGTELHTNKNRFGSFEMEIERVAIRDSQGRSATEIRSGDSLVVQIGYCASTRIPAPVFSASISRADGSVLFDTNTAAEGLKLPTLQGRGHVELEINRIDLSAGDYFVDVGIFEREWSYGYDYHWHAYPLKVCSSVPTKGVIQPPRVWQFHPAQACENEQSQELQIATGA